MNIRSLPWALAVAALLTGCDGQEPAKDATDPPPGPWQANALLGPFPDVAGFCKSLRAPACEERTDVIISLSNARQPMASKDGEIQLLTVASNDGKAQRAHLVLRRGSELFALPAVDEYDPKDGKRHVVSVRAFKEEFGLFVLTYQTEVSDGDGATAHQEIHARQAHCRVAKDYPIACALFDTEHVVSATENLTAIPEQTAEVLVVPAAGGKVTVIAHGQSGAAGLKLLAAPGDYQIAFP